MALEEYRSKRFNPASQARIVQCNRIIDDYLAKGLRLTLRQLYYQLVSRAIIENVEKSYKNLSSLVSDARLAGLMDWDAIEDRGRQPWSVTEFENLADLAKAAVASYRLPRWETQDYYVELWVEKDALAGVLRPLARKYHVTLMVNKGYSSQSAMHAAAERFKEHLMKGLVLFYLGDHDPSGEDMVRDIRDRLAMFGVEVDVRKIALTMPQIRRYKPPPNPAKITDPRASAYIAEHGKHSWEVDALPPEVLAQLIETEFADVVDVHAMDRVKEAEEKDKKRLLAAVKKLMKTEP